MKKNKIYIIFILLFVIQACNDDERLYSIIRQYYPNAFITQVGADLRTAAQADTSIKIDAYYARIIGEFTAIEDTIAEYGHVWSINNQNPIINPTDETTYSKLGERMPSYPVTDGVFESRITLDPETPFWVRSYIITLSGDTGYNKIIYHDTTAPPIDTWFEQGEFSGIERENAVYFSMESTQIVDGNKISKNCGYIGFGNSASGTYNDLWEFDPTDGATGRWSPISVPNELQARTGAIGVSVTYKDESGKNTFVKAYIGLGQNNKGLFLNDWWEYDRFYNTWTKRKSFPSFARKGAVAFSINEKIYVGLGNGGTYYDDFYRYDPKRDSWEQIPNFPGGQRSDAISFVVGNNAFIGTGRDKNGLYKNDLWMYVPSDVDSDFGFWARRNDMPIEAGYRADATAFAIDDQGYVGTGFDGTNLLSDFWRYDPYNNIWFERADYKNGNNQLDPGNNSSLISPNVRSAAGFSISGKGYLGTGYVGEEYYSKYVKFFWVYRP